jgi:predicted  nucleic acid-binding Zn-ribbon protein
LLDVQKVDLKIQGMEIEASAIPRQIRDWESSLQIHKLELNKLIQAIEERRKEQRQLERSLEQKQTALVKFNTQLPLIKTNREYKAILLEVDTVEKEIGDLEEQILSKMDEVEGVEVQVKQKEAELRKMQQEIEKEKDRLQQQKNALDACLKDTRSERQQMAAGVEVSLLNQYDRIRSHKGGLAIAHIRDESCGACHMALPPQLVNEVMGGRIRACPSCSRLLHWEEEEQQDGADEQ